MTFTFPRRGRSAVGHSPDLDRVFSLPIRSWGREDLETLVEVLTKRFVRRETDKRGEPVRLRPLQAVALLEMAQLRGAFLPVRVGGGKSLISFLAPRMFPHVKRPLLLVPGGIARDVPTKLAELSQDWDIPVYLRTESYEKLSLKSGVGMLDAYAPELLILDEADECKSASAAARKRVQRYVSDHPDTIVVAMSGTFFARSIRDCAHIARWCLGDDSPLPVRELVVEEWSRALDSRVSDSRRLDFGPLGSRERFQTRLASTRGVIVSQEDPLPIPLNVHGHYLEISPVVRDAYKKLRELWETPDGWEIMDPPAVWRHARELSTGFYSVWDPRPPSDWIGPRKAWATSAREIIKTNKRRIDTEAQARDAVREGLYPKFARALEEWGKAEPSFEPNARPEWISHDTIEWIAQWLEGRAPTLVWTERPCVGEALSKRLRVPYYAAQGLDSSGRLITDDPGTTHVILSIGANKRGRDLQHVWSRNLLVDVPSNGLDCEQLIGRTHRDGQRAATVEVDLLFGCIEDVEAFWRARDEDSEFAEEMTGQAQKLQHAILHGVLSIEEARQKGGPQWVKGD